MKADFIMRSRIVHEDEFLERTLLLLYEKQEEDEQDVEHTIHRNAVGFNLSDGSILTQYAKQLKDGTALDPTQRMDAIRKMSKYAVQLLKYLDPEDNR